MSQRLATSSQRGERELGGFINDHLIPLHGFAKPFWDIRVLAGGIRRFDQRSSHIGILSSAEQNFWQQRTLGESLLELSARLIRLIELLCKMKCCDSTLQELLVAVR